MCYIITRKPSHGVWCEEPDIYLIQKSFHKITKKTGFFPYFNFISFFFASIIPKKIIEREKKLYLYHNQIAGELSEMRKIFQNDTHGRNT